MKQTHRIGLPFGGQLSGPHLVTSALEDNRLMGVGGSVWVPM